MENALVNVYPFLFLGIGNYHNVSIFHYSFSLQGRWLLYLIDGKQRLGNCQFHRAIHQQMAVMSLQAFQNSCAEGNSINIQMVSRSAHVFSKLHNRPRLLSLCAPYLYDKTVVLAVVMWGCLYETCTPVTKLIVIFLLLWNKVNQYKEWGFLKSV